MIFFYFLQMQIYICLSIQAPCDNLRTPSTYPGNMLPHHPGQGNFEDFTCWETQEHMRVMENNQSRPHQSITDPSRPLQNTWNPTTREEKYKFCVYFHMETCETFPLNVKEILPQTPGSLVTRISSRGLSRNVTRTSNQPLAAGPWCLCVHSDCSKLFWDQWLT